MTIMQERTDLSDVESDDAPAREVAALLAEQETAAPSMGTAPATSVAAEAHSARADSTATAPTSRGSSSSVGVPAVGSVMS
ncbi:peptidoglycan hydrolase CwlO-like protein [Streptomyces umbrinus]|uniref:Peptidoglycan hydrolase CwlO-like protein n=1 Tax=Streptomyces umbrinus TaxID=67370 RepID=A0ABU0T6M4_9ACTN|nr:hypothetical protein [Streptomyces umbrinus]MDQ1031317.1 peptidoglycan hydrolase CwlO-like protein [Streptomyces umbrinus]